MLMKAGACGNTVVSAGAAFESKFFSGPAKLDSSSWLLCCVVRVLCVVRVDFRDCD